LKAAVAQLAPVLARKDKNLEKIEAAVASQESDLVLLGEMFLTGYMARDEIPRLAETRDGPSVKRVAKIAAEHGSHIVFGMPERDARGKHLYNASFLVTPRGDVHAYRKIHPANFGPFEEELYFGRGSDLTLVPTPIGKIGLMICYDAFFPELAKSYALAGAEVLAIISAAPSTSKPFFDKILPARAIENAVFVLYANLVGTELNVVFQGGSQAIGPRAEDLGRAKDFQEEVVHADVDLKALPVAREFRPTLRDTHEDLFRRIAPSAPVRPSKQKKQ